MTGAAEPFPDLVGSARIELEQARLLRANLVRSCLFVEAVIVYLTVMIVAFGTVEFALLWLLAASVMVGVTFVHAKLRAPGEVTSENYKPYLRGHIVVCSLTGLVWALFASLKLNPGDVLSMFVAANMIFAITVGGILPGSEYRPGYIALASFAILPFGAYWIYALDGTTRVAALGLLLYYVFGLLVSGQTDRDMRDGIIARTNRRLTEELVERNKTIEKVSAERTRFLAATSHDLSQPLHAQGFFIQALRGELSTGKQRQLLDRIEATWRSQIELLRGIVDITRIDSGSVVPALQTIELNTVTGSLADEFSRQAQEKGLTFDSSSANVVVSTDPVLLSRILRNLLSNAVRYTPQHGEVFLRTRSQDGVVEIEIGDTGPGIPVERQEDIFEEYVRLEDEDPAKPGLGLGLSIVRRLVDILGLDLELKSSAGNGTRWVLRLPEGAEAETPEPLPVKTGRPVFARPPNCLIVDDNQEILDSMSEMLTAWGCRTRAAMSGDQAVSLLESSVKPPDILFVDRRLANQEDGVDTIARLRDVLDEQTPAVLMTGDIAALDTLTSSLSIQVMLKPVVPDDLEQVLRTLDRRKGAGPAAVS
ncbi:hybrid sensor histidine kinase/response regulator [Henriciella marina]|uniref:hybrid sensor histidine kinase/response regulator n=1 Tax=Henriciella marina TaxID=453851 RepID=UPI00036EFB9F|nr:hybrid sensor histidine kinase/response regulator [Henriciella marina]